MITIGKNILENLTTGMYTDSKVSYREYIQNACDQIDKAIILGFLSPEDALIDIYIDSSKRNITIKDNGTGASAKTFRSELGDIANSNKKQGEDKGFRGIGRLCGLAYCETLKFTTTYQGENLGSIMICNAGRMRQMLYEDKKYNIEEILNEIIVFETFEADEEDRYFEVELININNASSDLLDKNKVKEYLNFVAPIPYRNTFSFRKKIHKYAEDNGYRLDEYVIKINDEQIFKEYTTTIKTMSGTNIKNYDQITDVEFYNIFHEDRPVAWIWTGICSFKGILNDKANPMRGIRLRQSNIQIGIHDVFVNLFKETRGNGYFVGEVFALDKGLIPNSQRDYFNENDMRKIFEDNLEHYFKKLHKVYHDASVLRSALKKQETLLNKVDEYTDKIDNKDFTNEIEKTQLEEVLKKTELEAEISRKSIEKYHNNAQKDTTSKVVSHNIKNDFNSNELTNKVKKIDVEKIIAKGNEKVKKTNIYVAGNLTKLSSSEQKVVTKIMSIIKDTVPKDVAIELNNKIKGEFK